MNVNRNSQTLILFLREKDILAIFFHIFWQGNFNFPAQTRYSRLDLRLRSKTEGKQICTCVKVAIKVARFLSLKLIKRD